MSIEGAEGTPSGVPTFTTAGDVDESSTGDELLQMQETHSDLFFAATGAMDHDTQRKVLQAVYDGFGSVTYDEIESYVTVSRRTVRKHVGRLEEKGLLERVDSRSYAVAFPCFEAEALVEHALKCYFA